MFVRVKGIVNQQNIHELFGIDVPRNTTEEVIWLNNDRVNFIKEYEDGTIDIFMADSRDVIRCETEYLDLLLGQQELTGRFYG